MRLFPRHRCLLLSDRSPTEILATLGGIVAPQRGENTFRCERLFEGIVQDDEFRIRSITATRSPARLGIEGTVRARPEGSVLDVEFAVEAQRLGFVCVLTLFTTAMMLVGSGGQLLCLLIPLGMWIWMTTGFYLRLPSEKNLFVGALNAAAGGNGPGLIEEVGG